MKMKIKKNDMVMVMTGDNKGETGRVLEVYPKTNKVLVENVNIVKRHTKPNQQNPKGGIIDKEMPVNYSNVQVMDSDGKPTKVEIRREDEGGKIQSVRYAKTNGKKL